MVFLVCSFFVLRCLRGVKNMEKVSVYGRVEQAAVLCITGSEKNVILYIHEELWIHPHIKWEIPPLCLCFAPLVALLPLSSSSLELFLGPRRSWREMGKHTTKQSVFRENNTHIQFVLGKMWMGREKAREWEPSQKAMKLYGRSTQSHNNKIHENTQISLKCSWGRYLWEFAWTAE